MVKTRAPNCPSLSLAVAIEKVERVYCVEGKNTFNGEAVVKHIGYNGLNGASRRSLGALRSYGLICGRGGDLRVSDDAVVIIADAQSPDQSERQDSLRNCLKFNRVFADLVDQFGQGSTLLTLTSYLQKQYGFKPNAAKRTAKVYKDSVTLIHWGQTGLLVVARKPVYEPVEFAGDFVNPKQATSIDSANVQTGTDPVTSRPENSNFNVKEERFALDQGNVILKWPERISQESFEDLTDWLLIMHRRIARDVVGKTTIFLEKQDKLA